MNKTVERRIAAQSSGGSPPSGPRTSPADLARLAGQAERRGVRILLTPGGQHVATSTTDPTRAYRVSVEGCECRGFGFWGRCQHHGLLLAELGRLEPVAPEAPAPTDPAAGLSPAEVVALKAQAAMDAASTGTLRHWLTGQVLEAAA